MAPRTSVPSEGRARSVRGEALPLRAFLAGPRFAEGPRRAYRSHRSANPSRCRLFGATLGAGNLTAVRCDLQRDAEALFKSDAKARKPLLNAALRDYRGHMNQARSLAVKPREYERASASVKDLARERSQKTSDVASLEGDERALRRLVSVTGPLARRQRVVAELETLADIPALAQDATTRREIALEKHAGATDELKAENSRVDDLRRDIAAVGRS